MDTPPVHAELKRQLALMQRVHASISSYEPAPTRPPVIDSSIDGPDADEPANQERIPGLRPLLETVKRDMDVMQKFLTDPHSAALPPLSTNAPYLIAVWKEALLAPPPVVALGKTFFEGTAEKRAGKAVGVKVDVVADGGRTWIRVITTKNSRLLSEFRELDSYMTDSSDDADADALPSLAPTELDNSVLRAGRALLSAAQNNPLPGTARAPTIVLRLTRLDPHPPDTREYDARIAQTLRMLRDMGVVVALGERDDALLAAVRAPGRPRALRPTARINLDLSVLIALVSDLAHAELPPSDAAAHARFVPSAAYLEWKRSRLRSKIYGDRNQNQGDGEDVDGAEDNGKHSRALAEQLQQEMQKGILQEMVERISASSSPSVPPLEAIEFWTTPEARDRCLRIISKIGGPNEKSRTYALFPPEPSGSATSLAAQEEQYWAHSRYAYRFLPLLPIHVFPSSDPPASSSASPTSAFHALEHTCRALLTQETAPHPRALAPDLVREELQRATVMRANPKLTAHTVQSMLWGAVNGWTTLTANKASVKAVLKEMKARGLGLNGGAGEVHEEGEVALVDAVLWMVDPRSLAEGMRSDFGA